ncbi:MAG: hypothetical protein ACLS43_02705 [Evtepia gabavorous]
MESRYARRWDRTPVTLRQRTNAHQMPKVRLVDMKQELRQGNATGLSGLLREELEENLRRGEQSILFLNRRGNSRMVVCSQCGEVPTCPRCSVHLTYHSANGRLMCHYCGHSQPLPELCPHCYGRLQFVGMGTQKLQEALEESSPGVEIMRMDADTITATQSHEVLLDRFRWKQVPILLGTQMVAKGLDFANVTLVGWTAICPYTQTIPGTERTFPTRWWWAGRGELGRRIRPGPRTTM